MRYGQLNAFILLVSLPFTSYAAECKPVLLDSESLKLVVPYINAVKAARETDYAVNPVPQRQAWEQLEGILNNKSLNGDLAIAYLLHVYVGEHTSERLECSALMRGERMGNLLKKYQSCLPLIGVEPLPESFSLDSSVTSDVIKRIYAGEKCKDNE